MHWNDSLNKDRTAPHPTAGWLAGSRLQALMTNNSNYFQSLNCLLCEIPCAHFQVGNSVRYRFGTGPDPTPGAIQTWSRLAYSSTSDFISGQSSEVPIPMKHVSSINITSKSQSEIETVAVVRNLLWNKTL